VKLVTEETAQDDHHDHAELLRESMVAARRAANHPDTSKPIARALEATADLCENHLDRRRRR
jgi:hypothetical protein